jgi:hypothetical protein
MPTSDGPPDDLDRLKGAAQELISASRGFLDAVEEVLTDDERLRAISEGVGDVVRSITSAVRKVGGERTAEGPEPHGRVERITVE